MRPLPAGPAAAPEIVYENADVRVVVFDVGGDDLVLSFSNMLFKANGNDFWGRQFYQKNGYSAVGFVAKGPNWFPAASMAPAIAAVRQTIGKFKTRIAYGNSMGGYAALKFSHQLGADVAIAFSPQYSIDPAVVGAFEKRFTTCFDPSRHAEMAIRPEDCTARAYIFFDPFEEPDKRHVELISAARPEVRRLGVPMTGHHSITVFAGSASGNLLLDCCKQDDCERLRGFIAQARRRNPTRASYIAERLVFRHPAWVGGVLAKAETAAPAHDLARCYIHIAQIHRDAKRLPEMNACADKAAQVVQTLSLEDRAFHRLNGVLHAAAGLLAHGRDFEAAARASRASVIGAPANTGCLRRLMRLELVLGHMREAIEIVSHLLHLDPALLETLQKDLQNRHGQTILDLLPTIAEAVRAGKASTPGPWLAGLLNQGGAGDPRAADVLKKARALFQDGEDEAAERLLAEAAKTFPDDADIRRALLAHYKNHNRFADIVEALAPYPCESLQPDALRLLARALIRTGRDDKAVEALTVRPTETAGDAALLASALFNLKRYDEAAAAAATALARDPDNADVVRLWARALRALKRYDEALPLFERARDLRPALARSHFELGLALLDLGLCEAACDALERARALDASNPPLLIELARARIRLGERGAAMDLLLQALRRDPGDIRAGVELARCAGALRRFEEIAPAMQALLERHPENPDVLYEVGRVYADPGRARDLFQKALALKPDFHQCHHRLARLAHDQGGLDEALRHYSAAIDQAPHLAGYRLDRATAHLDRGDADAARRDLARALEIEPNNAKAGLLAQRAREMKPQTAAETTRLAES